MCLHDRGLCGITDASYSIGTCQSKLIKTVQLEQKHFLYKPITELEMFEY